MKTLRGFTDPEIPAMAPGGDYADVTEGVPGRVAVIRLTDDKVLSRVFVGAGAHHLASARTSSRSGSRSDSQRRRSRSSGR